MTEKTEAEVISIIKSRLHDACSGEKIGQAMTDKIKKVLDDAIEEGLISDSSNYVNFTSDVKVQPLPEVNMIDIEISIEK